MSLKSEVSQTWIAIWKSFFAFLDGRGWVALLVGSALFLLVQTLPRIEILISTLGLVFICIGVAIIARRLILHQYNLSDSMEKAITENNTAAAIQNGIVIVLMCVIMYITAAFLNA